MLELIEDASNELTGSFRLLVKRLMNHLEELDKQVGELEVQIKTWHRASDASGKLEMIPGIGPITASALVASVGNAKNFDDGRQLAAWLGLVPKQHSSGGKSTLLGISKRGDFPGVRMGSTAVLRFKDPSYTMRMAIVQTAANQVSVTFMSFFTRRSAFCAT